MLQQIKNPNFYAMILADAVAFSLSQILADCLRFEFALTSDHIDSILTLLPIIVAGKLAVFGVFRLYKGMWRYSSLSDFRHLAQASLVSALFSITIVVFVTTFNGYSRAVFLLDGILTFLFASGVRTAVRSYYGTQTGRQEPHGPSFHPDIPRRDPKRIVIIGAGDSGEKMLREIFYNSYRNYRVAGFLDDDPGKLGRTIHGVPVLGSVDDLPRVLLHHGIEQIFVSIPSATGSEMRRIIEICKNCDVPHKTLPGIAQIMDGEVSINDLRDVNYEDLLRRAPVRLDTTGITEYLTGRKVMVTGAGGSIGSELCRQLIRFRPEQLILVDAGETYLYDIQLELEHELHFDSYRTILTRVQNRQVMEDVFKTYRPDVVFHAAAYKHVPMLEQNPWEAVYNNVLGSQVVMELAAKHHAQRFVLVSTDKAVRPTNVMGTSKRVAELILQSMRGNGTRFMAVRFGNVLASSGSVIPVFRKQIQNGGPVTVTHPEITRYFMTIEEACQLILQAGALGNGGEIFMLEMGTPVKIADLAVDLIRLSGKEPGRDIEIVYTGLRPGEKLYEELITSNEDVIETEHEKIMVLHTNGHWNWNGNNSLERFRSRLMTELSDLTDTAEKRDAGAIKAKLQQMVPEYTPQDTQCSLQLEKVSSF